MTKPATNERLTISFWIWAIFDMESNPSYADLERRFVELKERGFNCIRLESGAGLCHDKDGRPRGEVVEHAACAYREHGLWGAVARTCCGPEDPSWHEFPDRLKRVNAVFTGEHE